MKKNITEMTMEEIEKFLVLKRELVEKKENYERDADALEKLLNEIRQVEPDFGKARRVVKPSKKVTMDDAKHGAAYRKIESLLRKTKGISGKAVSDTTGIKYQTCIARLKELEAGGKIRHEGEAKSQKWFLVE